MSAIEGRNRRFPQEHEVTGQDGQNGEENQCVQNCRPTGFPSGIDHVGITTGHFEETARLYQEGLGLRIVHTWGRDKKVYMMQTPDGTFVELFEGDPDPVEDLSQRLMDRPHPNGTWMHLAFRTDDIQKSFAKALAAGFTCKLEPTYADILEATPAPVYMYFAYVRGYDGEEIEFIQHLDGPVG